MSDSRLAASTPTPRFLLNALLIACPIGGVLAAFVLADPTANPDSHAFLALARSLLEGRGFTYVEPMMPGLELKAFRSPAYAALVATCLAVRGVGLALFVQGALAGATAALVADIARRIAGVRAGWIALIGLLAWGQPWRFAGELMSETLYTFWLGAALWLIVRARLRTLPRSEERGPDRIGEAMVLGAVTALAMLTRPSGFALLPGIALSLRRTPRVLVAALLCAIVLWAPWPARNARLLGAFVPSLTNGGLNAWNGTTGRLIGEGWELQAQQSARGEIGLDRMFWGLVRDEMQNDPIGSARRLARRAVNYLGPPPLVPRQIVLLLAWPLALLGVVAMARGRGLGRAALGAVAPTWTIQAGLTIAFVVNERYRFPGDPMLIAAAAIGIEALLARWGIARGALITAAVSLGIGLGSAALRGWL